MPIEFRNVSFAYHKGTPLEKKALQDLSFTLGAGEWKAVVGHTGSGKSTLAQLCNALLLPDEGAVLKGGRSYAELPKKELRHLRREVGLVFQYPEQQFFAETVEEEVAFAPRNWGYGEAEVREKVDAVLARVNLPEELKARSPLALSGGQKRRVAIASVLAAEPDYLVLDEPTTGLDAPGKRELLALLEELREKGLGILHITHDLDVALSWCAEILVLRKGRRVVQGSPEEILRRLEENPVEGLVLPPVAELTRLLRQRGCALPLSNHIRDILDFYGVIS